MIEDGKLSLLIAALQLFPAHHRIWKLERSVLYSFGIEPTISAEIDVLKEKTKECLGDRSAGLIELNGDAPRLGENNLRLDKRDNEQGTENAQIASKPMPVEFIHF
jgi:hypothetical protein